MNPSERLVAIACICSALGTLVACNKKADSSAAAGASSAAGGGGGGKRGLREAAFPVEVLRVEARPREMVVTAPGVVDAFEHVQVTARVSGVVDKVSFTDGQEIKKGQVLALVDSRRYSLNVSAARAALAKSEATSADSEASLKRRQNASANNPGLIPGEELETFQTKLRTSQADVDQAREALKLAQLNLDDSHVKAPTEGIIQTRSVETGQFVQAGTVIATLLQRDPMLLRFSVTTAEAPRLKVGMPVEFSLKESQQVYAATISLVSGAADAETRLVPVTAQVASDKKYWLRPGSFAQVVVKLPTQRVLPMMPQAAARPSERGFLAFVVEGDVAHERTLQLGLHTTDGWVEVRDGLNPGDMLVTRGVEALADGTKVKVVPASPAGSGSATVGPPGSSGGPSPRGAPAGAAGADPAVSGSGEPGGHRRGDGGRGSGQGKRDDSSAAAPGASPPGASPPGASP